MDVYCIISSESFLSAVFLWLCVLLFWWNPIQFEFFVLCMNLQVYRGTCCYQLISAFCTLWSHCYLNAKIINTSLLHVTVGASRQLCRLGHIPKLLSCLFMYYHRKTISFHNTWLYVLQNWKMHHIKYTPCWLGVMDFSGDMGLWCGLSKFLSIQYDCKSITVFSY